ncbi:hypothetical protein BDV93DRAFT_566434 [Ceratobasidium sp. AG-I]|nr:hypothetical protein BDV93DRAFT_566434 [Ceratobasidium sp. AG-I]
MIKDASGTQLAKDALGLLGRRELHGSRNPGSPVAATAEYARYGHGIAGSLFEMFHTEHCSVVEFRGGLWSTVAGLLISGFVGAGALFVILTVAEPKPARKERK